VFSEACGRGRAMRVGKESGMKASTLSRETGLLKTEKMRREPRREQKEDYPPEFNKQKNGKRGERRKGGKVNP